MHMRKGIFTLVLLTVILQAYAQKTLHETIRGDQGISKKFVELTSDQQTTFSRSQLRTILILSSVLARGLEKLVLPTKESPLAS